MLTADQLGRVRTLMIIAGVVGIVTGLLVLAWPAATVLVVAALLGVNLIVGGVVSMVSGATADEPGGERVLAIVAGLLSLLAGVVVFSRPVRSVALMVVILGAFWVVSGVSEAVGGLTGRSESRALAVISGVLSLGAGIVALSWPGATLVTLVWVAGVWMVMFGVIRIVMGLRLRKMVPVSPP
jgi:uncharacterized membrane protein HdeD (DUF308 family)